MLTQKAWSPYLAGVVIGLLQIPAFLIIETALGASSSYVTVGALFTSWIDPSILNIDYAAQPRRHDGQELVAGGAGRRRRPRRLHLDEDVRRAARRHLADLGSARSAPPRRPNATRSPSSAASSCCSAPASPTAAPAATAFPAWRNCRSARPSRSPPCSPAASPPPCSPCAASEGEPPCPSLLASSSASLMGIVFGFALEKSRVFEPGIIVGQMQLKQLHHAQGVPHRSGDRRRRARRAQRLRLREARPEGGACMPPISSAA